MTPYYGEALQNDILRLQEWTLKWLLKFNEDKCKVMHVERHNPGYQYLMGFTPVA